MLAAWPPHAEGLCWPTSGAHARPETNRQGLCCYGHKSGEAIECPHLMRSGPAAKLHAADLQRQIQHDQQSKRVK
jgi:hypothetical protein